jgi:hypothetical protein
MVATEDGRLQTAAELKPHFSYKNNLSSQDALTTPMSCSAVRILTDSSNAVQSCQFFEAVPLVPVTMTSNTGDGVQLISDSGNYYLYGCFISQNDACTHGTISWFYNGGDWQSNRDFPIFPQASRPNRFTIKFSEPKTVCGFSVGGIANYYGEYYCYANCLLIEGRESDADFWRPLGEVDFDPADRRTRYFDFPMDWTVGPLRITVQDVTHGECASNSDAVYLPPMQVWGK